MRGICLIEVDGVTNIVVPACAAVFLCRLQVLRARGGERHCDIAGGCATVFGLPWAAQSPHAACLSCCLPQLPCPPFHAYNHTCLAPCQVDSWYGEMADHLRSVDPNHLITTGEEVRSRCRILREGEAS